MIINLAPLSNQVSSKSVAIYDQDRATEVLAGVGMDNLSQITSVSVDESSQMAQHPTESGVKITDHQIFNPAEITLRLMMPGTRYINILHELRNLYYSSTKLKVKTKGGFHANMYLTDIPHDETVEIYDRLVFNLVFKQNIEVTPEQASFQMGSVKSAKYSDTTKLGDNVNKTEVPDGSSQRSILKGWMS